MADNKGERRKQKTPGESDVPGLEVRKVAGRLLGAVIEKKTSLDGLTDNTHGHPLYLALSPRDRALARAILGAALRHRQSIDKALDNFLDRPLPGKAHSLKQLFHIGAAQILYLDVPDHAAIDLAVTAAKIDPRNVRFSGLVNAVLRKFAREKENILAHPAIEAPQWFAALLTKAYGPEKAAAIINAQTEEPPLDLTVKETPELWAQKLGGIVLPLNSVRLGTLSGPLTEFEGFEDGAWWVQDVAAHLPALLMGDISGKQVADLCAAPGGKTAQLAMQGAVVSALDLSQNRLERLKANMDRLAFKVNTVVSDLKDFTPAHLFDAVLLDAPCSSTGTIRRHPDVLYTKGPDDILKLAKVQRTLLDHAVRLTKPGGVIMFSNCSLAPEEGEELCSIFLQETPTVTLSPIEPHEVPGLEMLIKENGTLRSTPADLPNDNPRLAGMDGFFAARFIKQK